MSNFSILSWNVHGVFTNINGFRYNKLHSPNFWEVVGDVKIFALIETHHLSTEIDQIQIDGFKCFNVCRKKKSRVGRNSGGLAVYVSNSLIQGVAKIPTSGSENILVKLNKLFFGLKNDIVVSFSYCVPEYSSYQLREQLDVYGDLEVKLSNIGPDFDKICLGDYNARTGLKLDYIQSEDNIDIPVPSEIYETDTAGSLPRRNMDPSTNKYGDNLLNLCKAVPLRICNGRKLGDILGSNTSYSYNGQSCVDYCLVSPSLYKKVKTFCVGNLVPTLSDHCPITVTVDVSVNSISKVSNYDFIAKPQKIPWSKDISFRFENILQSEEFREMSSSFLESDIEQTQNGIDQATARLSNIFIEGALRSDHSIKFCKPPNNMKPNHNSKKKKRKTHPKWHDTSCYEAHRSILLTSKLLQGDPKNAYLRGKLFSETKKYKKLIKNKQKQFVDNLFTELDSIKENNPKGYMDLVKTLRDGNFDKEVESDTSHISPQNWFSHFSELLSKNVESKQNDDLDSFIKNNWDISTPELNNPFTRFDLLSGLRQLKNNKASSFDQISNEMLKTGGNILIEPLLKLFNQIFTSSFYPSFWKYDILNPIHKSGEKDDPNNFRGISIASCFGKLFTTLLRNRLQSFCDSNGLISKFQGSGKKMSRTADNHLILRFLIDKIVKGEGKKLYCCFVDVKKAFDFTHRKMLFSKLISDYEIGGNFLKILSGLYSDHKVFVKVSDGLLQPIKTTIGLKQGCCLSSLLFNLFIDKLPAIFDQSCDPISVENESFNSLLWADDLLIMSRSPKGLQNAINKTHAFYKSIGLQINESKTKVMIFNGQGRKLADSPNHLFLIGTDVIEVVDTYQYLGIKLKPSGSMQYAVSELFDKANRAWFAISNVLYCHKRLPVAKGLQLFDSLIRPIATFSCEAWLPNILPKASFNSKQALLKSWENFKSEILNQKMCRLMLSVHKRSSRLAVLGELGRYPMLIASLKHCLKYEWHLSQCDSKSVVSMVVREMRSKPELDTWYSRVQVIKGLLNTDNIHGKKETVSKFLDKKLKSCFDRFWIDQINQTKFDINGNDHNKLRFYKSIKGSFSPEPYITNVTNRSQRAWLTRYRVSAVANLRVESGRYTRPVTPVEQRVCCYCSSNTLDDEMHAILQCSTMSLKRNCFIGRMSALCTGFESMSAENKLATVLCPKNTEMAICVSKFLGIISETRNKLDLGLSDDMLGRYTKH